MEFSVVVPVYNEAENVRPLLTEISRAVQGTGACEVIYVDDGSDDDTLAELRRAQADFPALRVLHHALRSGQSSALLSGVRAARAPWVITLDGDGRSACRFDRRDRDVAIGGIVEIIYGDFGAAGSESLRYRPSDISRTTANDSDFSFKRFHYVFLHFFGVRQNQPDAD